MTFFEIPSGVVSAFVFGIETPQAVLYTAFVGCVYIVWFGQYTEIAFLLSLFAFLFVWFYHSTQPILYIPIPTLYEIDILASGILNTPGPSGKNLAFLTSYSRATQASAPPLLSLIMQTYNREGAGAICKAKHGFGGWSVPIERFVHFLCAFFVLFLLLSVPIEQLGCGCLACSQLGI